MENEMITVPETNELSEKDYQKLIYEESLKQTALLEKQINFHAVICTIINLL